MQPKILERDSNEYFQLKVFCQILEDLTEDMRYEAKDTYFDAGQDWMWTTVVAYNLREGGSFQALNPRDWSEIVLDATNSRMREIAKENIKEYPRLYNEDTRD